MLFVYESERYGVRVRVGAGIHCETVWNYR